MTTDQICAALRGLADDLAGLHAPDTHLTGVDGEAAARGLAVCVPDPTGSKAVFELHADGDTAEEIARDALAGARRDYDPVAVVLHADGTVTTDVETEDAYAGASCGECGEATFATAAGVCHAADADHVPYAGEA